MHGLAGRGGVFRASACRHAQAASGIVAPRIADGGGVRQVVSIGEAAYFFRFGCTAGVNSLALVSAECRRLDQLSDWHAAQVQLAAAVNAAGLRKNMLTCCRGAYER